MKHCHSNRFKQGLYYIVGWASCDLNLTKLLDLDKKYSIQQTQLWYYERNKKYKRNL